MRMPYQINRIQETDIPGLLASGRLVMRRDKTFDGKLYAAGSPAPSDVDPRRLVQFYEKRDVAVLPQAAIQTPAVAGKGKKK
jgi:hypothetical protein